MGALEVDPDFADAYYNMACIYSLTKKVPLAIRYLNIAVLNGYVEHAAMEQDPDLDNLRKDPGYQEILQTMGLRSFTPMVVSCPGCGRVCR